MRRPYWGFHDITADMTSEDDVCARCGGTFHCGMNDAAPCACTTVRLDAATLAELRERYVGCLCLTCLQACSPGATRDAPTGEDPRVGPGPQKQEAGAVRDRPACED